MREITAPIELERYLHAYCIICTDPIYAESLSAVDHLWVDDLCKGFPICKECSEFVKHLDNWNWFDRIYKPQINSEEVKLRFPTGEVTLDKWLGTSE
jgi:hypothetical protein